MLLINKSVKWLDKQFTNQDYRYKTGGPPPVWSEDGIATVYYHQPIWSEDVLMRDAEKIENEGAVTRYVLPAGVYGI
ncbi:hypothetical protein C7H19_18355 [Aphanothece hegewaldii CCALA 016]|uniref:Uncharacterized protein n=1 Tax=Aphanothece hegewaldii CCALA 016 TaxID=2107694 RepID=A0A2T1LTU4_9CHRO|nr:hypothetical protein [Aphanothece hegewaldii]PSF34531.1 hypothetical protein C7H19_18355 [Aphanothece hegewaldii CCALA 016]